MIRVQNKQLKQQVLIFCLNMVVFVCVCVCVCINMMCAYAYVSEVCVCVCVHMQHLKREKPHLHAVTPFYVQWLITIGYGFKII